MYRNLNADVYEMESFKQAKEAYLERYDIKQLAKDSKVQAKRTLDYFDELIRPFNLKDLNQRNVDLFIKSRNDTDISTATVNKEIRYLKGFIRWLQKRGYHSGQLEIDFVKTPPIAHKALSNEQIKALIKSCPTLAWQIRILLSLVTGLRAGDVDRLKWQDIDFKQATIATMSRKTGKEMPNRPLPDELMPLLQVYIGTLHTGNPKLFQDNNIRKTWDKIKGDTRATRQQLRVTFSTLIQQYSSIDTARELLEHYSSKTTATHYTDRDLLLKLAVNKLPLSQWLEK